MIEKILILVCVLIVGLITVDALAQKPAAELWSMGYDFVNGYFIWVIWENRKELQSQSRRNNRR